MAQLRPIADAWRNELYKQSTQRKAEMTRLWLQMERDLDPAIAAYCYAPQDERTSRGRALTGRLAQHLNNLIPVTERVIRQAGINHMELGNRAGRSFLEVQGMPIQQRPGEPVFDEDNWRESLGKAKDLAIAGALAAMLRAGTGIADIRRIQAGISKGLSQMLMIGRDYPVFEFRASIARYETTGKWVRLSARAPTTCMACIMLDGTILENASDFADHPHGLCYIVPLKGSTWEGETGEEWFLGLTPDEQKGLMGEEYYEAWLVGEFDLDDLLLLVAAGYVIVRSLRDLREGEDEN